MLKMQLIYSVFNLFDQVDVVHYGVFNAPFSGPMFHYCAVFKLFNAFQKSKHANCCKSGTIQERRYSPTFKEGSEKMTMK